MNTNFIRITSTSTNKMASPEKLSSSRNRSVSVNFVCQRCCQPLKLHSSFDELDELTLSELSVPLYPNSDIDSSLSFLQTFQKSIDNNDDGVSRKLIAPVKLTEMGNGFMIIGDTQKADTEVINPDSLKVTATLFDILSDQSDVDHPLCEECTDNLLDQMDQQLRIAEDECKEYHNYLEQLDEDDDENNLEKLREELNSLEVEKTELQNELYEIEEKEKEMKGILGVFVEEQEKLQKEETRYWKEYSLLKRQMMLCEDEQKSINNQLDYAQSQYEKLSITNIFNATFHIWHSGHFGTINNFRLGRLPNFPVDWPEINAAWGQTALLLHCLAKKINLTFERYRLVPYGNHSYLESLDDKAKELPLYYSGGFRYLWDTKFDQAMVAFLDCLQQFREKVEGKDLSVTCQLPYKMETGRIGDKAGQTYSIKIQFNSDEEWTKALKFMLTNLKWALAWVSCPHNSSSVQESPYN